MASGEGALLRHPQSQLPKSELDAYFHKKMPSFKGIPSGIHSAIERGIPKQYKDMMRHDEPPGAQSMVQAPKPARRQQLTPESLLIPLSLLYPDVPG